MSLGRPCCNSVNSSIGIENGLTLYADFEFAGVSPGKAGGPGSAGWPRMPNTPLVGTSNEGLTGESVVDGTYARRVNTGQLVRCFNFVLSL